MVELLGKLLLLGKVLLEGKVVEYIGVELLGKLLPFSERCSFSGKVVEYIGVELLEKVLLEETSG